MKLVRALGVLVACLLLAGLVEMVWAQSKSDPEILKGLLLDLDSSMHNLRKGERLAASQRISRAQRAYSDLTENRITPTLVDLDNSINQSFEEMSRNPSESGVRELRSNVLLMAGKLGVSIPFVFEHAMFVVLGISALVSLVITLLSKRMVDWEKIRQIKAEVESWRKQMLEAQRRRDMKRLFKLKQDQRRIMALQSQMMTSSFKPMVLYLIAFFIFFYAVRGFYGNWVMVWLPFTLSLPIYGTLVSLGAFGWFIICYWGSSSVWRKLLIRD